MWTLAQIVLGMALRQGYIFLSVSIIVLLIVGVKIYSNRSVLSDDFASATGNKYELSGERIRIKTLEADGKRNETSMNADRNFAGTNMASSVYLQWSDLPPNTARIVVNRAPSALGPWTQVMDIHEVAATPSTGADVVDGTAQDWYYRLAAFDSSGQLLAVFPLLKISKYIQ